MPVLTICISLARLRLHPMQLGLRHNAKFCCSPVIVSHTRQHTTGFHTPADCCRCEGRLSDSSVWHIWLRPDRSTKERTLLDTALRRCLQHLVRRASCCEIQPACTCDQPVCTSNFIMLFGAVIHHGGVTPAAGKEDLASLHKLHQLCSVPSGIWLHGGNGCSQQPSKSAGPCCWQAGPGCQHDIPRCCQAECQGGQGLCSHEV